MNLIGVMQLVGLLIAPIGFLMATRLTLSWIYRIPMSQRVWTGVVAMLVAMAVTLSVAMLIKVGLRGPRLFHGSAGKPIPWGWMVIIASGAASAMCCTIVTLWRDLRRQPAAQHAMTIRCEDVGALIGSSPSNGGVSDRIARLAGNEIFHVDFVTRRVVAARAPESWAGLSILHLSDLHFNGTPSLAFFERVMGEFEQHPCDMIVFTGDLIDRPALVAWLAPTLGRLRAPLGCYFVLGNHDMQTEPSQTRAALARLGWIDVAGKCVERDVRGHRMIIAGTERPWMGSFPKFNSVRGDEFRLLLSHTPDYFRWARLREVDLMLAGHFHGGQIRVPLLGAMKSGAYLSGLYHSGPTLMHVSRGLGAMFPIRWRCKAEVTTLVLEWGGEIGTTKGTMMTK